MHVDSVRTTVREEFGQRIDQIESFVTRHGALFEGLAERRTMVVERVENFRYHHQRLDKSLVILLLGGTGTGKSTLINALAGREISGTAVRRAYTENYFIFHHRQTPIAFLNPALGKGDQWIPHDREPLREKVIIDAPDFDSLKEVNREKALAMLDLADLVICVVTSEKYRDRTLYEILEHARELKRFLFVYNKIDREYSEKVVDQLSSELAALEIGGEVFRVSALAACQNAADGGQRKTGEFGELVRVIEQELDHAQIREIKRKNLDGLFGTIRQEVVQAVPADFAQRVEGFPARLDAIRREAGQAVCQRTVQDVFAEESGELAGILKSIQYYSFGGVLGFYMALLDKLRALRPGYVSVASMDQFRMRRVLGRHCAGIDTARLREKMEHAGEAVGRALRELGLEEAPAARLRGLLESDAFYGELIEEVTDGLSSAFFAQFERYCLRKGRSWRLALRNVLFNLPPTGFCLFVVGKLVYEYFWQNEFLGSDYLISSGIVLLVICFLIQLGAEKRFARENWGFLAGLQQQVQQRIDQFLARRLGQELDAITAQVQQIRDDYQRIADSPEQLG